MNKRLVIELNTIVISIMITLLFIPYMIKNNESNKNTNLPIIEEIYEMSEEEIKKLPTKEIIEADESKCEKQFVEKEGLKNQGKISYNGTSDFPKVSLGKYKGLTYYSQIDKRWASHLYTSSGNKSQTIGTSGCGPTSASMVVTAIKGTITPPEMGDLFVKYGYRSKDNGTYLSAFKFVADTFDIEYKETSNLNTAISLLKNNNYVVVSCGNGLFTTGGHIMLITAIEGNTLKIYDPYLYNGKYNTSTRRGKVEVKGNTVYCSVDNFRKYGNYTRFFSYKHSGSEQENTDNQINTNSSTNKNNYTVGKYKVTTSLLNVRSGPGINYKIKKFNELTPNANLQNYTLGKTKLNGLTKGVIVTVSQVQGRFGKIPSGWICLDYCQKI